MGSRPRRRRSVVSGLALSLILAGVTTAPMARSAGTGAIRPVATNPLQMTSVSVLDLNGRIVKTQRLGGAMDITGLAPGTYAVGFELVALSPDGDPPTSPPAYYDVSEDGTTGIAQPESVGTFTPVTVVADQVTELLPLTLPRGTEVTGSLVCGRGTTNSIELAAVPATLPTPRIGLVNLQYATSSPYAVKGLDRDQYVLVARACRLFVFSGNTLDPRDAKPFTSPGTATRIQLPTLDQRTAQVFRDVRGSTMFAPEIQWMLMSGLTTGYADDTYRPLGNVSRDAMAAFLYRLAGAPAYAGTRACFRDVPATSQFAKEICWLKSTKITTGWPDGTYRPGLPIRRDAMAAFLYRFARWNGTPGVPGQSFFQDTYNVQFEAEMAWMFSNEISKGWPDRTYRPLELVHRDAMAAFLARFDYSLIKKHNTGYQPFGTRAGVPSGGSTLTSDAGARISGALLRAVARR